jgi:molybdopterin molybdotransferase
VPGPLPIEDARASILERITPLEAEPVQLAQAAGRVLAADATARVDLPPFPSSAMDGFAIRAEDAPGTLPVVFRIAAGRPSSRGLQSGQAMAVATGGVVPEGADAVVPIEDVVDHGDSVEIASAVAANVNVRARGGDIQVGETVCQAGTVLGAAHLGALGAAGIAEVACGSRPRVAVLTTGTELRPPGESLGAGQIYESNGVVIETLLRASGADVERLRLVADDEEALAEAVVHGLEADALVTSGGVSVGPHDLVRRILSAHGVEEVFWGVAVRPGRPLAFGVRGRTAVFGLPGNPVSTLVGCLLFVCPAALALQGASEPGPFYDTGILGATLGRNPRRDDLVRARRTVTAEGAELAPVEGQESHMIVRAAAAEALVHVPRGEGALRRGKLVRYLRLV